MNAEQLSTTVVDVLTTLRDRGELALVDDLPTAVLVERPQPRHLADWSTNVALQLAGPAGMDARELAGLLATELAATRGVADVHVAGPGFVNVRLDAATLGAVAPQVLTQGAAYGSAGAAEVLHSAELAGHDPAEVRSPLHHVQYAHAHACALLRHAADLGVLRSADELDVDALAQADTSLLVADEEAEVLRALADFPRAVRAATRVGDPAALVGHLDETADTFRRFDVSCRVLPRGDEEATDAHRARLLLVAAVRTVLANGLTMLGAPAPERM